jgi:two-component system, sensor histidine kinase and response regulator
MRADDRDSGSLNARILFFKKVKIMAQLKVLIVDDEPGIRSGIIRILHNFTVGYPFMDEDFEFELKDVETGEEAIDVIDSGNVDIILLDNKLPGIHGIEVLEYINKQQYDIEVMMITSHASLDLAVKATDNGAFNFIPKPFTPQELRAAMENITKHLYLKRMTRKMNEDGRQLRFQFLSVLSHELKSPVNAIEGYLLVMKDKQAGSDLDNYKVMIERSLERLKGMRSLINDLLDLTRMESGKKKREITSVDITEVFRVTRDTIEPLAAQKNVKIHPIVEEGIYINADRGEMEIILNNLLSNAVKYNREGGDVHVQLRKKDGQTLFEVEDTGIGMAEEEVAKLFQDFVRIKNQKTKNITGSGLGLSIVKKLVDLYQGEVIVESTPDVGSKFTVILPQN